MRGTRSLPALGLYGLGTPALYAWMLFGRRAHGIGLSVAQCLGRLAEVESALRELSAPGAGQQSPASLEGLLAVANHESSPARLCLHPAAPAPTGEGRRQGA
uniref:Uncharacterized protein n=1 Tax=Phaeomonas parva TaxID=124430 RepID=A0A6U4FM40_9STRA|mmetsp:Transcript_2626/g.7726  ORF Transcript_2626/g.7726 Transcript_2626/m.7726 type:complete len:102 (+) Transcript_2626:114-419(+)